MQIAGRAFPCSGTVGGREANLAQPAPAMAVQIQEASHVDGPQNPGQPLAVKQPSAAQAPLHSQPA